MKQWWSKVSPDLRMQGCDSAAKLSYCRLGQSNMFLPLGCPVQIRTHSGLFAMHKQHVDKKYKVVLGNVATQTGTVGALRDHAFTNVPAGTIEEGKIFFFYR